MYLRSLVLTHFKNYKAETALLAPGYNLITGLNGAGKTNLLDAIHYICLTKSFFQSQDQVLLYPGENFFRLEAIIEKDGLEEEVVCKIQPGQRKDIAINRQVYDRLTDHIGRFPLIMLTPDDIEVVKAYSDSRRRLLDSTLCQTDPAYLHYLIIYQKALGQRNAYLKALANPSLADSFLLQTYKEQLHSAGQIIYEKRKLFTHALAPVLKQIYQALAGNEEEASIFYDSQIHHRALLDLLDYNENSDIVMRRTSVGIHRDDWEFIVNENPVKKMGSQGQQKTFLLALKLSLHQYIYQKRGLLPFLLLDDIFDKLDKHRTAHLMEVVNTLGYPQIFITDTGAHDLQYIFPDDTKKINHIYIEKGKILK